MRSHLTQSLLAGAALLLLAAPSVAQPGYYPGGYYAPGPLVAVNTPAASVVVGARPFGVAVAAPFTNVYVGVRPFRTAVYAPGTSVIYTSGTPYYSRRAVRRWNRGGYVVGPAPAYYYYR